MIIVCFYRILALDILHKHMIVLIPNVPLITIPSSLRTKILADKISDRNFGKIIFGPILYASDK